MWKERERSKPRVQVGSVDAIMDTTITGAPDIRNCRGQGVEDGRTEHSWNDIRNCRGQGVEDGRTEHSWNPVGHRRRPPQTFAACDLR